MRRLLVAGVVACAAAAVVLAVAGAQEDGVVASVAGFELECPASVVEGADVVCELENVGDDVLDWPVVAALHRSDDSDRALVVGGLADVGFADLDPVIEPETGLWWVGDVLVGYSRFDWARLDGSDVGVVSTHEAVSDPDVTGYQIDRSVFGEATVTVTVANAAADTVVHLRHRSSGDWTAADAVAPESGSAVVTIGSLDAATEYRVEAALDAAFSQRVVAGSFTTPARTRQLTLRAVDDTRDEAREKFYVSLAPSETTGIGDLYANTEPVHINDGDDASSDASLSGLTMRSAFGGVDLAFAAGSLSYDVSVGYREAEVTVTPTASHDRAVIDVAGSPVDSGTQSQAIALGVGTSTFEIVVTPEDGLAGNARTYTINATRAARPDTVAVASGDFTLSCPSEATEGSELLCTLTNSGSSSADWPVVAIIHSATDSARALIAEDSVIPASSELYATDLRLHDAQNPSRDGYHYGHGQLFSGGSRSVHSAYGYESFDWDGTAASNETRNIAIQIFEDYRAEADETFYAAVAPSGYTGLSQLVDNKAPIVVAANTAMAQPTVTASDIGRYEATATATVPAEADGRLVHLRHRTDDTHQWTTATPIAASDGQAVFALTGLTAGTGHNIEAALDSAFHIPARYTFTTMQPPPAISSVEPSHASSTTATITATVTNAVAATRVHLRHRIGSGAWTTATDEAVTAGQAVFALSGLAPDSGYNIEAALDAAFDTVTTASFETDPPPPAITTARASEVTADSATVAVAVTNAVAATRVHLRYRIGSGAWTSATDEAVTAGQAVFALSGLAPDSGYNIEAALDAAFDTVTTASFETDPPPPAITTARASEVTADSATVAVAVTNAVAATRVHLRYRIGSGAWITATDEAVTAGQAVFALSGLAPDSGYNIEAALSAAFSPATTGTFTSLTPTIDGVEASNTGPNSATVAVAVTNPAAATRVHLRYRIGSGAWITATDEAVTAGQAVFALSGLAPDSGYNIEAALSAAFDTVTTASFETDPPPPAITTARASEVTADSATVAVAVTNAVAATRVHLRYRIGDAGAWITATDEAVTAGQAVFALSGLAPDSGYNIEAALSAAFDTVTTASFETDPPPPAITTARASEVTADSATVAVAVTNAVAATRVHLRYRIGDAGAWITATDEAVTAGQAVFALSGLAPDSGYNIEAALSAAFSPATTGTFTSNANPQISSVVHSEVDADTAKIAVAVLNAVAATRAHLRYRIGDAGAWITATDEAVTAGQAVFALSGLTPDSDYNIEAALDSDFSTLFAGTFATGALRDEPDRGPVRGGGGAPQEEPQVGESGGDGDLAQAAASRFQDVSADAYYAAAVGWMAANAITTGCTQDTFCPGRPVTRRQLVVFLWRAAAEPEPATPGSQIFGDVAAGSSADKAIGWAAQTGVTLGCAAATGDRPARFCGNQEVTRDQMSALLYRFFDGQPDTDQPDFADVDPGVYYAAAVGWMAANAITTGCAQNTYCPERPATRAHIATFIHRAATQPDIWGPDSRLQP